MPLCILSIFSGMIIRTFSLKDPKNRRKAPTNSDRHFDRGSSALRCGFSLLPVLVIQEQFSVALIAVIAVHCIRLYIYALYIYALYVVFNSYCWNCWQLYSRRINRRSYYGSTMKCTAIRTTNGAGLLSANYSRIIT